MASDRDVRPQERRLALTDPTVLESLAHPVRLDVLGYLMATGPATASQCARAVGDSPSNCSYHLRVLARHGLVEPDESGDGRSKPWRATVTGFTADTSGGSSDSGASQMLAAAVELDHQLARAHLRAREGLSEQWRRVEPHATYGLSLAPDELADVLRRIDEVVRPYIQATRQNVPTGAKYVHLGLDAFPRTDWGPR